jgi:hypothetical protein
MAYILRVRQLAVAIAKAWVGKGDSAKADDGGHEGSNSEEVHDVDFSE